MYIYIIQPTSNDFLSQINALNSITPSTEVLSTSPAEHRSSVDFLSQLDAINNITPSYKSNISPLSDNFLRHASLDLNESRNLLNNSMNLLDSTLQQATVTPSQSFTEHSSSSNLLADTLAMMDKAIDTYEKSKSN